MKKVILLTKAYAFAAERHVGQRRKGAAQEPCTNHLAEVADLVARATAGSDAALVASAVLHDTVEDTETVAEELRDGFGEDVAALVLEVSDDKSLPKAERKRRQVETAPRKSHCAKLIKLADKTSNLCAMRMSPPATWSRERRAAYLAWAREVAAGLRGASPWLEARFDEAAEALERALAQTEVSKPTLCQEEHALQDPRLGQLPRHG
jgi:(p)ppGpp synthase/HD superfamily hydrolase